MGVARSFTGMEISSNWCPSSPLQDLLSINHSQHWDENNVCDSPSVISLAQPQDEGVCKIILESGSAIITNIRVTSGARTVEYYTGRDEVYCGSYRGTYVILSDTQRERLGRLYWCVIDVSDAHTSVVTLKLPSLKGTNEVKLTKIEVMVANGNTDDDFSSKSGHQLEQEVESMFDMIQSTQDAPPFVMSLLTALKTSNISDNNVGDLSAMFKQVRTKETSPTINEDTPINNEDTPTEQVADTVINQEDDIKCYIDGKFLELREHIDSQLQQMKRDILHEINKNWKND